MNTIPNRDQTIALTRALREGRLTRAQREQTAQELTMIGSAMRVAAEAAEHDDHRVSAATVVGAWSPVATEYDRLLGIGADPSRSTRVSGC